MIEFGGRYPGRMEVGDYVLLPKEDGDSTRYQIKEHHDYADEAGLFMAIAEFAPRY